MFDQIKYYFQSKQKLAADNKFLTEALEANVKLMKVVHSKSTPELVVERVMRRGIGWYDYEEILNENAKKAYYNDAQSVVKNSAFVNELNHLFADQVEFIAKESRDHEETMRIRMTINAIELIKERLEGIYDPAKTPPTIDEINEAI